MSLKRTHLSADKRRAVTVEAVIDLAARQNPGDITTAAIAEQMNVTQGALFRHFPSKEAIWQAVMEWVAGRLLAKIDQAAKAAPGPLAALEAIFMAHIEFVSAHPGVPRMLFGELQRAEDTPAKSMARTLIQNYAKRVEGYIDKGKAETELDPAVDTAAAALLFIGSVQGLVMQSLLVGDITYMRKQAAAVFAIYIRAVEKRP